MSVIMMIFGAIAVMAVIGGNLWVDNQKVETTRKKIDTIHTALRNYYKVYGRLPCPGDFRLPQNNANWGSEADSPNPGTECTGGAITAMSTVQAHLVYGSLPVKELGLQDNMYYDGWDSSWFYYVDWRLTVAGTLMPGESNYIPQDDTSIGTIEIWTRNNLTAGASMILDNAVYALVSTGANRHGGYNESGKPVDGRGTPHGDEGENCECQPGE
jgi:type II secretory pathway pseudopilin PulG